MAVDVPMFDTASFTEEVTLGDTPYRFRFHWNYRGQFWVLDILDRDDNLLVAGIKIVASYEVIRRYGYRGIPQGALISSNTTEPYARLLRDSFVSGETSLVYFTEDEYAAI